MRQKDRLRAAGADASAATFHVGRELSNKMTTFLYHHLASPTKIHSLGHNHPSRFFYIH
jgi:hypothetical protein